MRLKPIDMKNKKLRPIEEAIIVKQLLEDFGVNIEHITDSEFFRIKRSIISVIDDVIEKGAVSFEGRDILGDKVK